MASVGGEARRRQLLSQIKERQEPNSSYFQEFLVEYELLSEYRLLQKNGPHNGVYVIPSSKVRNFRLFKYLFKKFKFFLSRH